LKIHVTGDNLVYHFHFSLNHHYYISSH